ncbi:MAG: hypothetical protein LH467_07675 [Gemmatimonadaceae bacterium]|nr:hypothetical protein [Gemmatimonadaceae bacterium]
MLTAWSLWDNMHRTRHYLIAPLVLVFALLAGCADSPTSAPLSPTAKSSMIICDDPAGCEAPPPSDAPPASGVDERPPLQAEANALRTDFDAMESGALSVPLSFAAGEPAAGVQIFLGCSLEYTECLMQCLDARYTFWEEWDNYWYADWDYGEAWMTGRTWLIGRPVTAMRNALYSMRQAGNKYRALNCRAYLS